jgi:transcription-repair coupling factor (superfamily II helicase)
MPEKELAQVMWDFANGEFDVLVCTTIIESGIDIPNVNTIIINQADHFGLSQLYQLRGRVGRSAVRAYAYLLYDKHTPLSEIARRRLEAIMEANELGAGFRIAMEDLEIRGAGDILGERQHGHIAAVGLDMYSRMLAQAVRELREGKTEPPPAESNGWRKPPAPDIPIGADQPLPLIDLPLAAYVPTAYVSEESLRLQLYRRLAALTTQEEIEEMAAELRDRFGALPEQVENLLYQLRIKATTLQLGLPAIVREDGQIVIRAPALERMNRDALQMKLGSRARVARRQIWLPADDEQAWKSALPQILAELAVAGG